MTKNYFLKTISLCIGMLLITATLPAKDFLWAKSIGGTSFEEGLAIAVDGSGNVYTTGFFEGTVDFDPGAGTANLTNAGSQDIFVSKLGPVTFFLFIKKQKHHEKNR